MTIWYKSYLQSRHWKNVKARFHARRGKACQDCGNACTTVRHRTYKNLGAEELEDLIIFCEACAKKLHYRPEDIDIINAPEPPEGVGRLLG